jgi:hypothetical protein
MLNRIFFITMISGSIALSGTAIAPNLPILAGIPVATTTQNPLAAPQDSTELPSLENLQNSRPATAGLDQLAPPSTMLQKTTIPLTDECRLDCLEQINGSNRRKSVLYGTRSGMKIGGLYGFISSNILTPRLAPLAGRVAWVTLATGCGAIAVGALGATIGLLYAHKKSRDTDTVNNKLGKN